MRWIGPLTVAVTTIQTFVAQCQEDMDTLNHWVNDTDKALGRRVRIATYFRTQNPQSIVSPPMTHEEVHDLLFLSFTPLNLRVS